MLEILLIFAFPIISPFFIASGVQELKETKAEYECNMYVVEMKSFMRKTQTQTICQCVSANGKETYWAEKSICDSLHQQPLKK